MSISIQYNGNSVTSHLITYTRDQNICSGTATTTLQFTKEFPYSPEPWDEVIITEDGNKKGTYNVVSYEQSATSGIISIQCQDDSKKLFDTFVFERYEYDYITNARFWIELFLNYANVTYEFNTASSGALVDANTILGVGIAYDLIVGLLQQSGWYIYFDPNGKAIIGELQRGSTYSEVFNSSNILEITVEKSDKMARNRAVIWGANPSTYVDMSVITPWSYDENDKRAVVLQNSSITNLNTSLLLANKIITEFRDLTVIKTIRAVGFYNLFIGDVVMVNSPAYRGLGMITTINVSVSDNGFITALVLDERCPRIFGYVATLGDYVYAGTWGSGIWRKPLNSTIWEDFSTGLDSYYIYDLHINNGLFATVAGNYLYIRTLTDTGWTKIHQGELTDETDTLYEESETICVTCTIDKATNVVWAGYVDINNTKSWVLSFNSDNTIDTQQQVYYLTEDLWNTKLIEIDHDSSYLHATLAINSAGLIDCGDTFTTNNETAPTKVFEAPVWASQIANPIMCGTEIVLALNPLPPNHNSSKIYVINHSQIYDPLVSVTHESSLLSTIGYASNLVKYNEDVYYLVGYDGSVSPSRKRYYRYNIRTGAFSLEGSHTGKNNFYQNIYYTATINKDSITLDWVDIFTQNTGVYTVNSPTRDNKTLIKSNIFSAGNVLIIGTLVESYNTPLSNDNAYCGCGDVGCPDTELCGSPDQESMYSGKQHHLTFQAIGINVDTLEEIHVEPVYIVSSVTSHGALVKSGLWSSNYKYSNGAFYIYVQAKMDDAGFWTCNPLWPGFLQTPCITTGTITYESGMLLELTGNATGIPGDIIFSGGFNDIIDEKLIVAEKETNGTIYVYSDTLPVGGTILYNSQGQFLSGNYGGGIYTINKLDYNYGQLYNLSTASSPGTLQIFLDSYILPDYPVNRDRHMLLTTLSTFSGESYANVYVGENIVAVLKSQFSGSLRYMVIFNKFGNDAEPITETYVTTTQTSGGFIYQDSTAYPHKLEISQNHPVSTFSPFDFTNFNLRLGGFNETYYSPPIDISPLNVSDVRLLGAIASGGSEYVAIGTEQSLKVAPTNFSSGWETVYTVSGGNISRIEASNYPIPPHYFVSISGIPVSGLGGIFYQKLTDDVSFSDHTGNLPSSLITIIRLDDIV